MLQNIQPLASGLAHLRLGSHAASQRSPRDCRAAPEPCPLWAGAYVLLESLLNVDCSLFIFTKLLFALGIPKAILRFSDSLGELLTGFHIESYSWLGFTTVKGVKAKSAKGKGAWDEVQRRQGTSFQESSPHGITQDTLNSSSTEVRRHLTCYLPGKSLKPQCPRAFVGDWSCRYVHTAYHVSKFQIPRRKAHCLYKQLAQWTTLISSRNGRSLLEIQVSNASQVSTRQADLCRGNSQTCYVSSFLHFPIHQALY